MPVTASGLAAVFPDREVSQRVSGLAQPLHQFLNVRVMQHRGSVVIPAPIREREKPNISGILHFALNAAYPVPSPHGFAFSAFPTCHLNPFDFPQVQTHKLSTGLTVYNRLIHRLTLSFLSIFPTYPQGKTFIVFPNSAFSKRTRPLIALCAPSGTGYFLVPKYLSKSTNRHVVKHTKVDVT